MIKVGIIGGNNLMAGELLRLLLLHPDVELMWVYEPSLQGRSLCSLYRGLVGDSVLKFTERLDLDNIDMVFITDSKLPIKKEFPKEVKVVLIQEGDRFTVQESLTHIDFIPGVSEMFRKPLVRGGAASRILPAATTVALIVLFPLALHLLLNDSLKIKVSLPVYKRSEIDKEHMKTELENLLKKVQFSFNGIQNISIENSNLLRTISVEIEFDSGVTEEEIERIYNETYDDHNFTFILRNEPAATEVAGTQKCLLYIYRHAEGKVRVKAIADSFLRGGAGDGIHSMNLLFGLYEKTGLSFPAIMAFKHDEIKPEEI